MMVIKSSDGRASRTNLTGEQLSCSRAGFIVDRRAGDVQNIIIFATKIARGYIFARRSHNPQ